METVTIGDWESFFTAQVGAGAALGGLVFVGLSLNLTKILSYPALPIRAALALVVLLGILVVSSFALIPGQSVFILGSEILAAGVVLTAICALMERYTVRKVALRNTPNFIANTVLLVLAVVPYVVGGAIMAGGSESGLYWVAAGLIVSFIKAVVDAWVLLVEINR